MKDTREEEHTQTILTPEHHSEYREDFLGVRIGRDVAEADTRETGEGEIERRNVFRPDVRTAPRVVRQVRHIRRVGQVVEPADRRLQSLSLVVGDCIEDARKPVADQREASHQKEQHGRTVL